jgi:hypothetical protein
MTIDTEFILKLVEYGVLLPVVFGLGWFAYKQHKEIIKLQESRVADAKAVSDQLVKLVDTVNKTTGELSKYSEEIGDKLDGRLEDIWKTIQALRDLVLQCPARGSK